MSVTCSVGKTTRGEVRATINGHVHILDTKTASELAEAIANVVYKIDGDAEWWARMIRQEHSS
ncbi:hypothetical protein F8O06_02840 [Pseudoclavibacter sp. CFCC 14310]|uniref:hypothetical protein n=1 Tax=Pseudoclavibacter sp. CFCC 14310 TaxID=2615180 RepID=UPI001301492D|nr:hypothetical protein [Pseudoclavibacter sp. CFCC 14310]KAB1647494.1 hypothetical protein F8O06_02840 [Pseudoclavibacter sp. CFCC 14310]